MSHSSTESMQQRRLPWPPTTRDCNVAQVEHVCAHLVIPLYVTDITGDAWDDMDTPRGYFMKRIIQVMLACMRMDTIGTNKKDADGKIIPSFMFKDDIPKNEAFFEAADTEDGHTGGSRLHIISHDPDYHFGDALLALIKSNCLKETEHKRRQSFSKRATEEHLLPGTEYEACTSLDWWRKVLIGAYPELSATLDVKRVYALNAHIVSSQNPANPHELFSVESQINKLKVPIEVSMKKAMPCDRQMDPGNYRNALRRDVDEEPDSANMFDLHPRQEFAVRGMRSKHPLARDEGDDGRRRAQQRRDEERAQEDGAGGVPDNSSAFPMANRVYPLPVGPDCTPEYIFKRLRPDASQRRATNYSMEAPHDLSVQDSIVLNEDVEVSGRLKMMNDMRLDMEESERTDAKDCGIEEQLARYDPLLAMRLRNKAELKGLKRANAELEPEEMKKVLADWKQKKFADMMDYFRCGDASTMNVNMLAVRNWYNREIAERGTLAGTRLPLDPKIGSLGNMLATLLSFWDQIAEGYSSHFYFLTVYLAIFSAYQPDFGPTVNVLLFGDPETSKTYVLNKIMKHCLIPGTVQWVTRTSLRAYQESGNRNGTVNFIDEAESSLLGYDAKNPIADAWLKSSMTSGIGRVDRQEQGTDGQFHTRSSVTGCMASTITCANVGSEKMDPALGTRFLRAAVKNGARHVDDIAQEEGYHGHWKIDQELVANLEKYFQTMHCLYYLRECATKVMCMEDVDTTIVEHHATQFDKLCKERGVKITGRDVERIKIVGRTLAIMESIHTRVFLPVDPDLKTQVWQDNFVLKLEPSLVASHAAASTVVGLHAMHLIPQESKDVLQAALSANGGTMPVFVNGQLNNGRDVEFAQDASFVSGKRNSPFDWVKLGTGSLDVIAKKTHRKMSRPKPSLAEVRELFQHLEETDIECENRDNQGNVITSVGAVPCKFTDDNNCDADSAAPNTAKKAAGNLDCFTLLAQPGKHAVTALVSDTQSGKKTYYVATQLLTETQQFMSIVDEARERASHAYIRPMLVPTGQPFVDGNNRTWVNLMGFAPMKPNSTTITVRHLFEADGLAMPLYADAKTTSFARDPSSRIDYTIVREDYETKLCVDRVRRLVPAEEIPRELNFVPKRVGEILEQICTDELYLEQSIIKPINYPWDLAEKSLAKTKLGCELKRDPTKKITDHRVRVSKDSDAILGCAQPFDVSKSRPSHYMRGNVVNEVLLAKSQNPDIALGIMSDAAVLPAKRARQEDEQPQARREEVRQPKVISVPAMPKALSLSFPHDSVPRAASGVSIKDFMLKNRASRTEPPPHKRTRTDDSPGTRGDSDASDDSVEAFLMTSTSSDSADAAEAAKTAERKSKLTRILESGGEEEEGDGGGGQACS